MIDQLIIGYDAKRIVSNGTGLGSYGRTLVNDIARCAKFGNSWSAESGDSALQLRLYAPDEGKECLRQMVSQSENIVFSVRKHRFPSKKTPFSAVENALWRSHGIINDLQRDGVQLYHGLSGELPVGIHKSGIKSIVTIHDLIFLRHPEYYHWIDAKIYAWKFHRTIREADHIIAISECTKRDIMEYGHIDESRISVIYQSYAPRFNISPSPCEAGNPSRYILSVGSIEERKNILLVVKALPYLPEDISLVIVGRHTTYTDQVINYAKTHNLSQRVRILHGVTDEELPALYAGAEAFVYPSRYEGFGIPIVEAISMGLPVVACTGSCLEEAGGPDSLYVNPDDAEGIAQAIRQSLKGTEGREERITRSREYIRRFEGQDVANQVVRLYQSLLEGMRT